MCIDIQGSRLERLPGGPVRETPGVPNEYAYAPPDPEDGRGHLLDLYLPDDINAGARRPVVIWTSGSAFLSDDGKVGAAPAAAYFNAQGWIVVGVSVRSSLQATFPAQVHDVKAAVRWIRAHAVEFGIDVTRIAIMGNSSGGWVSAMAGLTATNPELNGAIGPHSGANCTVQAVVDLYGPTNFLAMDAHMTPEAMQAFNGLLKTTDGHNDEKSPESLLLGASIATVPDLCAAANPATYAHVDAPAVLIVHGQADPLVPHHQSELLFQSLWDVGADATFVSIPDLGHEHPFIDDPTRSRDRIVATTRPTDDAVVAELRLNGPTWAAIHRFFADAMRVDR